MLVDRFAGVECVGRATIPKESSKSGTVGAPPVVGLPLERGVLRDDGIAGGPPIAGVPREDIGIEGCNGLNQEHFYKYLFLFPR